MVDGKRQLGRLDKAAGRLAGGKMKNTGNRRLAIVIFAAVLGAAGCNYVSGPPSDKELIDKFPSNRVHLEKIVEMMKQDTALDVVTADEMKGADPGNAVTAPKEVSAERLAEYRSLLKKIGAMTVNREDNGIGITLAVRSKSLSDMLWKGYLYTETPPSPLAKSLDGATDKKAYKSIADNWYIFIEQD